MLKTKVVRLRQLNSQCRPCNTHCSYEWSYVRQRHTVAWQLSASHSEKCHAQGPGVDQLHLCVHHVFCMCMYGASYVCSRSALGIAVGVQLVEEDWTAHAAYLPEMVCDMAFHYRGYW